MKPKILVDTRERDYSIFEHLTNYVTSDKKYKNKVEISLKSGGSGDYIIVDKEGNQWGIERKSFTDCYSSILQKDADGRERAQAQLAELMDDYGDRAIFMLEADGYVSKKVKTPIFVIKQAVYTFTTRRSFLMPVILYANPKHGAYLLLDMAVKLPVIEIKGRGVVVKRE